MLNDDTPEETMMKALMGRSGEEGCAMEMLRESLAEYTNVVEVDEDERKRARAEFDQHLLHLSQGEEYIFNKEFALSKYEDDLKCELFWVQVGVFLRNNPLEPARIVHILMASENLDSARRDGMTFYQIGMPDEMVPYVIALEANAQPVDL